MFCTHDWLPSSNINEVMMVQNIDTFVRHGDVINNVINNIFHMHGHTAMAHLHIKFDDRFRVIKKNMPISLKSDYIKVSLSHLAVTSSMASSV